MSASGAAAALAGRLEALSGPEQAAARGALIREELISTCPTTREVAVAWAARYLEPVELLQYMGDDADAVLRNAAVSALERQGPVAVEALAATIGGGDADLAMLACLVLGRVESRGSVPALIRALERPEVNVVQAAAEGLGRLRAAEAFPALTGLLHREPWLQLAAIDALGAIGDPRAVWPLLELVPDSFVAIPALDALGRIAAPGVVAPLLALLLDPARTELRVPLLRALGPAVERSGPSEELTAAGCAIEADHGPASVHHLLAERLSGAEDPPEGGNGGEDDRATPRGGSPSARAAAALTLAGGITSLWPLAIRHGADRDWARWMQPIGRTIREVSGATLAALLTHGDAAVRAGTLRTLAPALLGEARILPLLDDRDSAVRVAALESLGELEQPTLGETLGARLWSEVERERAAAVQGLARLPEATVGEVLERALGDAAPAPAQVAGLEVFRRRRVGALDLRVLRLARSPVTAVRRAALAAAAAIPGSAAEVVLFRALADREPQVQVAALELLVARGGPRVGATLLALLGMADSMRYHVIRALGRLGDPASAAPLEALFDSAPLHEQLEILSSLERIGSPHSRAFLAAGLDHAQVEIRRAAAQGIASLATAEDLPLLARLAASPDWVLRSEAARAMGRLKAPRAVPMLLDLARDLEPVVAQSARAALAGCP